MLNPVTNQRELAYVVIINEIKPIPDYDRVEHARVGGWWVIVKKGQFKPGDLAIYIEVDSQVPQVEPFMFLEKKHFTVKTQRMCRVYSQGLLMAPSDFGWETTYGKPRMIITDNGKVLEEGAFLTETLNITYADPVDTKRKFNPPDKYKKMAQRKPNIFKQPWARWMMKRHWGRKIMFVFFGRKKDKKGAWPSWIKKTDEERCQNMPWLFPGGDEEFYATEKIDGSSTTFAIKGRGKKQEYLVCSRNVVFDTPDKKAFYDTNIYIEMSEKYNIKEVLSHFMATDFNLDYVILQGETYGEGVQKRGYNKKGRDFMAFNLIFGYKDGYVKKTNSLEMTQLLDIHGVPCVPIVDKKFKIPTTCDELLILAEGSSVIDGGMREGLVIRSKDGQRSFKAVSNPFLLKYHS